MNGISGMNIAPTSQKYVCSVCASSDTFIIMELRDIPILCNVKWPTPAQARNTAKGDISLSFCNNCAHVFNHVFEHDRFSYSAQYENTLSFSPLFQEYTHRLVLDLTRRYNLHSKTIVDIGCGDCNFLTSLCELGQNDGIGFDPSLEHRPDLDEKNLKIRFIPDMYSERHASLYADFICCRHVLEHIPDPLGFLQRIRKSIGNHLNSVLFFEVPNALFIFRDLSIWDIIYEHYSYFHETSLEYLFRISGFSVQKIYEAYSGQFLCIEATPAEKTEIPAGFIERVKSFSQYALKFQTAFKEKLERLSFKLGEIQKKSHRAVVWGAGSKGVMFCNIMKVCETVKYVVDINPRKEGMHISGTGQKIVSPQFLSRYRPEVIFVMNSIYLNEISKMLREQKLSSELFIV